MSTFSTTYPAGMSAPLATDNDNNHSGLIVVITALNLVLVLASVAAQISSVYQRKIIEHYDYLFGGLVLPEQIVAITQASVVFVEVHYGWGTQAESLTAENKDRMLKAVYVADILSVVVLGFSKTATCILYEVLFSQFNRQVIRVILVGICGWTLLSVLLLAIRCGQHPWSDISAQCRGLFPMWQVITAVDIVSEILLMLYSGLAIYKVRIAAKKKLIVFLALECRIFLVALAALHLYYIKMQLDSEYPTLRGAYATMTTEIYLFLSVICLVTSSLKSFIAVYEKDKSNSASYTPRASRSRYTSQLMISSPGVPSSKNVNPYTSTASMDRSRGWERMEEEEELTISNDPRDSDHGRGLQILKTVHLSVQDEHIELEEQSVGARIR